MGDNNLLLTKEQYNEALRNYGKFLVCMLAMYSIFMVLVCRWVAIADWIEDKWQGFKSLFQRKQHYDLSENSEF